MVEMISSGDFSLAPLEAGILLHHPVETQSRNRRKIGKKSGSLPPVFFPWVSSLFLVLSALTPQAKSWMLSSYNTIFSPVRGGSQFSLPVMSNPLRPHGLQLTRLPCPSPTPGACSNSCPQSRWCHPTISSSAIPFSSCRQFCSASGYFPMSQFFASGGQSIGVSASASVLPMNIQGWFPLVWYPCNPMDSQESSPASRFQSINSLVLNLLYGLSHLYMTTGKTIVLTRWTLLTKWRLCFLICCLGWS